MKNSLKRFFAAALIICTAATVASQSIPDGMRAENKRMYMLQTDYFIGKADENFDELFKEELQKSVDIILAEHPFFDSQQFIARLEKHAAQIKERMIKSQERNFSFDHINSKLKLRMFIEREARIELGKQQKVRKARSPEAVRAIRDTRTVARKESGDILWQDNQDSTTFTVTDERPHSHGRMITASIDGVSVEYFVPGHKPVRLSADGNTVIEGITAVVVLDDPKVPQTPLRISAPQNRLQSLDKSFSGTAEFLITYIPDGGEDLWEEPCVEFPEAAKAAFNAAAAIWADLLDSSVPITIRAGWADLEGSTLGYSGGGYLHRNFSGAPRNNTWYSASLANSLAETDLAPDAYDMHITYNENFTWYFGTDGNTPSGQHDFLTVALHEIAHGLNFSGSMRVNSGQGSWGWNSGYPVIYDFYAKDGSSTALISTADYPNPSAALASALTSNSVWFHGNAAMTANSGQRVKLYAPSDWMPGSSYSHLDYHTFSGTANALMVYALSSGNSIHDPGSVTMGLLNDLGWNSTETPGAVELLVGADPYQTTLNAGDEHWYYFNANLDGVYTIQTYGNTDTYMYLYASDQTTLLASNDDGGEGLNAKISQFLTSGSAYYAKVRGYSSSTSGNYSIDVYLELPEPPVSEADSLALVALYNSTDGDNWTNNTGWLDGPVGSWHGITVEGGRVTEIVLRDNNLSGTLPAELGNLGNLLVLWLDENQLTGPIPPGLGNLSNLLSLALYINQLEGLIPSSLGSLTELVYLGLFGNDLTGEIPLSLANLVNLQRLTLRDNQLTGSIPPELGNLTNLQGLWLYNNQFTGAIPPELGNLGNLWGLYLGGNQLTGSIPAELGNLGNLRQLYLESNQLTGTIPSELGNLSNLWRLWLDSNEFTFLPDLSGLSGTLTEGFRVQHNHLTFESIEPNIGITGFEYSPQDSTDTDGPTQVAEGSSFELSVAVGGTANAYRWYKDGAIIPGAESSTYSVASASAGDAGVYHCRITNTIATELTIYSRVKQVAIGEGAGTHFTPVAPTGQSTAAVIQNALIDGEPLQNGDEIGIFDGDLCVGVEVFDGTYPMAIAIWMEYTPPDQNPLPGAASGNAMIFKVWDQSQARELPANPTYIEGSGTFGEPLTVVNPLEAVSAVTQTIPLAPSKLNMISFNVVPDNTNIADLLSNVSTLLVAQDDAGSFYIPPYGVNMIGEADLSKGYQVYHISQAEEQIINEGQPLDPTSLTHDLTNTKLYMIGYPYQHTHAATDVFASIAGSVVVVQNDAGQFWIPSYGVNMIGDMQPGKGYQIFVNGALSFAYPDLSGSGSTPGFAAGRKTDVSAKHDSKTLDPKHFTFTETGQPYAVLITSSEVELKAGDEIGLYDGGLCVGAGVFDGTYPLVISAWQEVKHEELILPGYKPGNPISLKIKRDADTGPRPATVRFKENSSTSYGTGGLTSLIIETMAESQSVPAEFLLGQNYPNPFNPKTQISYDIAEAGRVELIVYDIQGRTIRTLYEGALSPGRYEAVWHGDDESGRQVASGVYIYVLRTEGRTVLKKKCLFMK